MLDLPAECVRDISDYLGFHPSRFFLWHTCSKLHQVEAPVFLAQEELRLCIQEKLVNLRNIRVKPLESMSEYDLSPILKLALRDRYHLLRMLLQNISPASLATNLGEETIERILWTFWISKDHQFIKKIAEARALRQNAYGQYDAEFLIEHKEDIISMFKKDPVDFLKKVVTETLPPKTRPDWDILMVNALSAQAKRCLLFLIQASGIPLFSVTAVLRAMAEGGEAILMTEHIRVFNPNVPHMREDLIRALGIGIFENRFDICSLILKRLGGLRKPNEMKSRLLEIVLANPSWKPGHEPDIELAKLLVANKADYRLKNEHGESLLDIAAKKGFSNLVSYFQSLGLKLENLGGDLEGILGKDFDFFKSVVGSRGEFIDRKCLESGASLLYYGILAQCDPRIYEFILNLSYGSDNRAKAKLVAETFSCALDRAGKDGRYAERLGFLKFVLDKYPLVVRQFDDVDGVYPLGRVFFVEPPHRRVWDSKPVVRDSHWMTRFTEPKRMQETGEEAFSDDDDEFEDRIEYGFGFRNAEDEFEQFHFTDRPSRREVPPEPKPQTPLELAWAQSVVDEKQLAAIEELKRVMIAKGSRELIEGEYFGWIKSEGLNRTRALKPEFLELMLKNGLNPNMIVSYSGERIIDAYAALGFVDQVKVLLKHGAKAEDTARSALVAAAGHAGNIEIINLLIKKKCDVNRLDRSTKYKYGALHAAACAGSAENVKALLEKGAQVDKRSGKRELTPFMLAFMNETIIGTFAPVGAILLKWKADINARDAEGQTALFLAGITGQMPEFEWLIMHGADASIPDRFGVRTIDLVAFVVRYEKKLLQKGVRKWDVELRPLPREDPDEPVMPMRWMYPCAHAKILDLIIEMTGANVPSSLPRNMSDSQFAKKYGFVTITEYIDRESRK